MILDNAVSVKDLNRYIKAVFDSDDFLSSVAVRGEISNCKLHSTGHIYFTLKDDESEISAVMFRSSATRLTFVPKSGMRVTVWGSVSVYEKSGKYQIYVTSMTSDGVGELYAEYERLRQKLSAEGLFDESKKRVLPSFPRKIGIITSPEGAALQDMLNITGRRYSSAEILIYPSLVQGANAPRALLQGVEYLNFDATCDVIIIGRGGGSIEDLWAFNDEMLVRAVAASRIPIISAVGHETDFTLCDFAADRRAPTPSAAAELAVPDMRVLLQELAGYAESIDSALEKYINRAKAELLSKKRLLEVSSPEQRLSERRERLGAVRSALCLNMSRIFERDKMALSRSAAALAALNPLSILSRGYGAVTDEKGGCISSVADIKENQKIKIYMSDGCAEATVNSKEIGKSLTGSGK